MPQFTFDFLLFLNFIKNENKIKNYCFIVHEAGRPNAWSPLD